MLACVIAIQYRGLWHNNFYKDDYAWVADARAAASDIRTLARPNPDNSEILVRPFQRALFTLTYAIDGAAPGGYFFLQLVLHALASCAVFEFLRIVLQARGVDPVRGARLALGGGLFFACSHTDASAVVWIAAQSTLLVTLAVAALAAFVVRAPAIGPRRELAVTVAGFVVALYAKSVAVAFPLVYPCLCAVRTKPPPTRRIVLWTALLVAIAATHAVYTKSMLGGVHIDRALSGSGDGTYRLGGNVLHNLAAALVQVFMIPLEYRLLFGAHLSPLIGAAVIVLLFFLLGDFGDRRLVILGGVWILAFALPTALFDYDQFDTGHVTVDRYFYPGQVGAALLVVAAIRLLLERLPRRAAFAVLALIALPWTFWSFRMVHNQVRWHHDFGMARQRSIDKTLEWAMAHARPGGVVYTLGWKAEDAHIRSMSRLYFEPRGFRLASEAEYDSLGTPPPADGVPRYVARYIPELRSIRLGPLLTTPQAGP